jgi:hypothetical protein
LKQLTLVVVVIGPAILFKGGFKFFFYFLCVGCGFEVKHLALWVIGVVS